MSNRRPEAERRRSSQFDFSNRRDGEREDDSWSRDNRERNANPDRLPQHQRPSSDDRNPPPQSAKASTSRGLDPPPALQRSLTAPSASNTKPSTKSPLDPSVTKFNDRLRPAVSLLTTRVALKTRKDAVDQSISRLKREREKTEAKYSDFPSVRDLHKHQEERLQQEAQEIKKELDVNSNRLNLSIQSFASNLQQFCSDAAAKPLQAGDSSAHDTSVTAKLDALAKRTSQLESQLTEATNEIQSLKQENAELKSKIDGDSSVIRQSVDALTDGQSQLENSIKDLRAEISETHGDGSKTSDPDAHIQGRQLVDLKSRVDYIETALNELDPEFVQGACHDFTLKLPQVQQELDALRAEVVKSMPTSVDQTGGPVEERIMGHLSSLQSEMVNKSQLQEATEKFQSSQFSIAATFGRKLNQLQDHLNKLNERIKATEDDGGPNQVQPDKPTASGDGSAPDGTKEDANWNSEEARMQALETARAARAAQLQHQHQEQQHEQQQRQCTPVPTATLPTTSTLPTTPVLSITASELASMREEIRSLQDQFKAQETTHVSQAQMAELMASTEEAMRKLSARIQAVEEAQEAAERTRREENEKHNLPQKFEWLGRKMQDVCATSERSQASMRQALNTLEDKYNNLTTDELLKKIMDHTQPHRPVVQMLEGLQSRTSTLEGRLASMPMYNGEPATKKRKINASDESTSALPNDNAGGRQP